MTPQAAADWARNNGLGFVHRDLLEKFAHYCIDRTRAFDNATRYNLPEEAYDPFPQGAAWREVAERRRLEKWTS